MTTVKHTWVLAGMAILLAGYICIFESPFRSAHRPERQGRRVLPELRAEAIDSIRLQANGASVELKRRSAVWWMEEPIKDVAASARVEDWIQRLSRLEFESVLSSDEVAGSGGPSAFGFAPPGETIELGQGDRRIKLLVGESEPIGHIVFVRRGDPGPVFTVAARALPRWTGTVAYWRDRRLIRGPLGRIDRIEVLRTNESFVLERKGTGGQRWFFGEPFSGERVGQQRLESLLGMMKEVEVSAFVEEAPVEGLDRYGLAVPWVEVKLSSPEGPGFHLEIGAVDKEHGKLRFARVTPPGRVVKLSKRVIELFAQPLSAFVEPYLIDRGLRFTRLTVEGTETFSLAPHGSGNSWWVRSAKEFRADSELVGRFQRQLSELRIIELIRPGAGDVSSLGLDHPTLRLKFERAGDSGTGASETSVLEIAFGRRVRDRIYARRSDRETVYGLPAGQVLRLPQRALLLRDRRVWRFSLDQIARVTVHHAGGVSELDRAGEGWVLDGKALPVVESQSVSRAFVELGQLKAVEWREYHPGQLESLGLTEPAGFRMGLFAAKADKMPRWKVVVGKPTPRGHRYALTEIAKAPAVFIFPHALFLALQGCFGSSVR